MPIVDPVDFERTQTGADKKRDTDSLLLRVQLQVETHEFLQFGSERVGDEAARPWVKQPEAFTDPFPPNLIQEREVEMAVEIDVQSAERPREPTSGCSTIHLDALEHLGRVAREDINAAGVRPVLGIIAGGGIPCEDETIRWQPGRNLNGSYHNI